ncbi:MAG: hypothetical protein NVSMB1_22950 [Polyangiales bacterium]
MGAYFAECAQLEAASVIAFEVLRDELVAHGAPRALVKRASRAMRDERRHALMVGALARRHGVIPQSPTVVRRPVRSLFEIARENAMEGVVNETYGAVSALWRATHAEDVAVRRAMHAIARDECEHANLSWHVAAWATEHLSMSERSAIATAVREAVAALKENLRAEPSSELVAQAGLPSAASARALVNQLDAEWWTQAA